MEALKQLKDQYDCMTKGKIVTKNGIFLDNSFQPNADFYKVGFQIDCLVDCRDFDSLIL